MGAIVCLWKKARACAVLAVFGTAAAYAAVPIFPPAYTEMKFDFNDAAAAPVGWQPVSGRWHQNDGTYNSTATAATALTIVDVVSALGIADGTQCHAPCMREAVNSRDFVYHARMVNHSSADDALLGLIYSYQDARNYFEVVFSPAGVAQLRRVQDGVLTVIATSSYEGGNRKSWFDVDLVRRGWDTTVRVNGNAIFSDVTQGPESLEGLLGLATHNTTGRFENVDEKGLYGNQPYKETFDDGFAHGQSPDAGLWEVQSGTYVDTDAPQSAFSLSFMFPENTSLFQFRDFGLRARLFNPYGASGNRVGLVWNYKRFEYNEVVFTPTGFAQVNRVTSSGSTTVATAPIPLLKRKWFEAEVQVEDLPDGQWAVNIRLDGKPLFTRLQGENVLPGGFHEGHVGFVTHWSPGRFDDVNFQVGGFPPTYTQPFKAPPSDIAIVAGDWQTADGAYLSRALGQNDIALLPTGSASAASGIEGSETYTYTPDFVYRARLRNPENGAVSSVGLITNYSGNGEYYETVFSGNGKVHMNKIVQGMKIRQGSAHYRVPPNTWFDVEIRRVGTTSSLRVNGELLLSGIPEGQLKAGRAGLITHAAEGAFDKVSWSELR